ncbi:MAG: hypothetical protein UV33_C0004G0004 [Candidatus Daviesbacteria bacterium GW2011_GWA1_42_6]|uniref:Polysaccharide biosynthesis protein n=1 Tax=Candidatus Daviesbacteria bacterium GW2011_GWA1_42_6 TaxID=1618420 RepID=A0A0G1D379_9BACT|nr:MAG: hypothetical protein UV33_C0004G0004 [Candidatus Daviesbacteria bacterium GW2011_GWA1_42_6]
MELWRIISEIVNTKTLRHFIVTSGGTAVNGFLGLLFYIVVARELGPQVYGVLAIAVASIALISDISDLGIDTGLIRFVGKYRQEDKEKTLKFIKLGLTVKLAVWLVVLLTGWAIMPMIAETVFLKPELGLPLQFSLIGALGAMLFSLGTHVIQAYQKFWSWSILNISMNGLRLSAVIILAGFGILGLLPTLITYIAIPFMGFFVTLFLLPQFLTVRNSKSVGSELFHYSKWVALVGILTATGSRLDTFLSARLLTVRDVGIYSAASQITVVIPQLVFALATVVAPKLASFDSDIKAIEYLKKLQLLVFGMFILGLLAIPVLVLLIPQIYGTAYLESITPFVVLFVAQLVFLLSVPSHQAIFYYFGRCNSLDSKFI